MYPPVVLTDVAQERLGQVQLWKLQVHHSKEQGVDGQVRRVLNLDDGFEDVANNL